MLAKELGVSEPPSVLVMTSIRTTPPHKGAVSSPQSGAVPLSQVSWREPQVENFSLSPVPWLSFLNLSCTECLVWGLLEKGVAAVPSRAGVR